LPQPVFSGTEIDNQKVSDQTWLLAKYSSL
jgi:hypothetical protein